MLFYAWFGMWCFDTRYLAPVQIGVVLAISVFVMLVRERTTLTCERGRRIRIGFFALVGLFVVAIGSAIVSDAAMVWGDAAELTPATRRGNRLPPLRTQGEQGHAEGRGCRGLSEWRAAAYFGTGHITVIILTAWSTATRRHRSSRTGP